MGEPSFWPEHIDVATTPANWAAAGYGFMLAARVLLEERRAACEADWPEGESVLSERARWRTARVGVALPALVCLGNAIELVLKSLFIQKDPSLVSEKGYIHHRLKTHNLVTLAQRAGVTTDHDERQLLTRLKDYVEWGRYPTTLKPEAYKEPWEDSLRYHPHCVFDPDEFADPLFALWERFFNEFQGRSASAKTPAKPVEPRIVDRASSEESLDRSASAET